MAAAPCRTGRRNYLFCAAIMTMPVAITVEGANILTRTLITFAQGALRAHPYLYRRDRGGAEHGPGRAGIAAFDTAFAGHVSFMLRNIAGSFLHAVSFGAFASTPVDATRWRAGTGSSRRYSQIFALVGDWTVALPRRRPEAQAAALGPHGRYPRRPLSAVRDAQALRGRRPARGGPAGGRCHRARPALSIEQSFAGVFANFPIVGLRNLMRVLVFPLGRHAKPASDRDNYGDRARGAAARRASATGSPAASIIDGRSQGSRPACSKTR